MCGRTKLHSTAMLLAGLLAAFGVATFRAEGVVMNFQITSTAFAEGQAIPEKFTCQGKNISPPLTWSNAPANTKGFALIADDPDAPSGTWVHWVVYNFPASATGLPENVEKSQYISGNAKQGINDFRHLGYGGPCPPPGKPHHYHFKLYALDAMLDLKPGARKADVLKAMEGHILARAELIGTYQRR